MARSTSARHPVLAPVLLVLCAAVATHSVVRYRWWIVAVYTLAALALAAVLLLGRRDRQEPSPPHRLSGPLAIAVAGVATLLVPAYTYLAPAQAAGVRWLLAGSALAAAVALALPRREAPVLALGAALAGYVAAAAVLVRLDPAPRIDVWVILQQGTDGLLRGENLYRQTWEGSPGVQDAFTYLPWTAVILAPGRWLTGDVRWALVGITVLAAAAIWWAGRDGGDERRRLAAGAACLLLLLPGTATQVEQAWTEPLLFACLAGWALAAQRGRTALAVVFLALALASKQHIVLLLPVLAAWPAFGLRRTAASAGLAGVLMLPWVLTAPADLWHDAVTLLVDFQPLLFADTLFIAAIRELGWTPPFWLTGALVLSALAAATVAVHRRQPDLGEVVRWAALVLLVANLVNKQAFYNQYWLVMALLLLSWALDGAAERVSPPPRRREVAQA